MRVDSPSWGERLHRNGIEQGDEGMKLKTVKYAAALLACGLLGACAHAPRTLQEYDARKIGRAHV